MEAEDQGFAQEPGEGYGLEPFEQEGASLLGDDPASPPAIPPPAATDRSEAAPPLALYRRYRPDTFADVIGQEHVTEPLQRALTNNRVNHAYLFSGPRGCGKTTSARILARCLNCEQGPTPEPCGQCQSCRDLARGGPGSIDVIELDAASHGGVDEARDLRERAFFAPVQSRYKVYIVDEAHMVTTHGFNALLKLVEEPPAHVKFIFATTEPEKVIGTIRSRTHHYPFRLVPPRTLQTYLAQLCEAEGIAVEPTVLPLVVRAGAGSVRDSLSVLDQLLGGAAESGVTYAQAAAILGYTPDSLLDEIVDSFAAGDAAGVFACIDRVIEVGQDPRRFAEDLLHRLRDLLIVAAVPDALNTGLVETAEDQADRLRSQSAALGGGELTRAAEVMATGLTEMRGTTAPRLHLELMCARVLLPGADVDERGFHARLDRLERRLAGLPVDAGTPPVTEHDQSAVPSAVAPAPEATPPSAVPPAPSAGPPRPEPPRPEPPRAEPSRLEPEPQSTTASGSAAPGLGVTDVRRLWRDVLDVVRQRRRYTWILLDQYAQIADVSDGVLTLAMKNPGARENFSRGDNEDILRGAIAEVLRADLRIQTIVDGAAPPVGNARPAPTAPSAAPRPPAEVSPAAPPAPPPGQAPQPGPAPEAGVPNGQSAAALARDQIRPTRGKAAQEQAPAESDYDPYDDVADDSEELPAHELIAKHLGAELIDEENANGA